MDRPPSRRHAALALLAATGYIFATPEPATAQGPAARTLRFPLDGFDALAFTYKGTTVSFTPKEIFDILAPGKVGP